MKIKLASYSAAFSNPKFLVGLATCVSTLVVVALAFTFAPSGTARAENSEDLTPEISDIGVDPDGAPCTNFWTAGPLLPVPILDNAVTAVGTNLYSFGGVTGVAINSAFKFDGTTWTSIAPLPVALEYPAAVTDGTNIYIVGGATPTTPQSTLYRYNVASNTYTTLASFSTATWNHSAIFLSGKIYKFTGTGPLTNSTNALEIYDIASNTWSAGAPYPISASFVSGFTTGGFIYGCGGLTLPATQPSPRPIGTTQPQILGTTHQSLIFPQPVSEPRLAFSMATPFWPAVMSQAARPQTFLTPSFHGIPEPTPGRVFRIC